MIVTIIGIGLIGGSLAKEMRKLNFASKIIGVEKNIIHAQKALDLKIVDQILDLDSAIIQSDLIIISVPVDIACEIAPKILDKIDEQIVFDVGSTKKSILNSIKNHPKRENFVGIHPMAGTENTGPEAAILNLFENNAVIFCDTKNSSHKAISLTKYLFNLLKMRIIEMEPEAHDIHAAYVSHISHISSFALALTVLHKEKNEKNIFDMASGGFESTVRLAKSSAKMWTPIFQQNKDNVLEVLDTYINFLYDFKLAIFNEDSERLNFLMQKGNSVEKILNKKQNLLSLETLNK